ncbi:Neurofilament medium polypeptide [Labeo rohita]|uniref:Neurofilament medium polypeptide n=1 Tax=Labeo rohita TaxID=84645 RepID=A0ABQ8M8K5_LABRO|nr:Neurofilament medium polypeptide [Labeo rohita]
MTSEATPITAATPPTYTCDARSHAHRLPFSHFRVSGFRIGACRVNVFPVTAAAVLNKIFWFRCVFPMDPLLRPEFILLKQGGLPLEGYTTMFQLVADATSYPDDALCAFYDTSLNASCRAPSSEDGPRADFAAFVEWTLARNRSTPDPEPSQPPPRHAEHAHEPTVREPAIVTATVRSSVEREYAEDSITHGTTAEGELNLDLGQNLTPSNSHPISTLSPLSPVNPSAHPQLTICAVGSPRVCQSPLVSWLEDPSSSPPASESWTLPRPSDPAAPPRLSAPSSPPSPVSPPAPPGSIVPPAPPRSVVAPPSPQSSVAPAPPRTSGSPPLPWPPEPWALPGPSGSSVSPRIIGSPSPPWALPPPAPPQSVGPRELSACPPPWLLPPSASPWVIMAAVWVRLGSSCFRSLLSPPWLLSPSSPPWTIPSPPWTPSFALPSEVRPPPKLLPKTLYILFSLFVGTRTCLPGGEVNVTPLDFLVGFSHHFPLQLCVLVSPSLSAPVCVVATQMFDNHYVHYYIQQHNTSISQSVIFLSNLHPCSGIKTMEVGHEVRHLCQSTIVGAASVSVTASESGSI